MYKIAICDDNSDYLEFVKHKISFYCSQKHIPVILDAYSDSDQLGEIAEEKNLYDAYILDIEMPLLSGIDIANKIKIYSPNSYIIFLTAFESYAVKACDINVLGYILKDTINEELDGILKKLFFYLDSLANDSLYIINNQRRYIKLLQKDIIYIYKKQKNVIFVMKNSNEEQDRISLQNVITKLNSQDMYLLDRCIILNLRYVQKIVDDKIFMFGDHMLITTKKHIIELKEQLLLYWRNYI